MRRRGHKSTKVPNVKLRPAQQGASSRAIAREITAEGIYAQDSQLGSDDTHIYDTCPRPFQGIVLCATGVPDKPGVFKQAVELGAATSNPFTDRITHLIALQHGGAKYTCALERKIPILLPSFVTESYEIWLRGDDVDVTEVMAKHRLPVFSDIVVCPSGITNIQRRTDINDMVTQHGGKYLKNLERPVRVTHLLCSGEEKTDKMRYAEKFNRTGEANIKMVWEEWFWDSLDYGGRFDEKAYEVNQPRPDLRINSTQQAVPLPEGGMAASTVDINALVKKKNAEKAQQLEKDEERTKTKAKENKVSSQKPTERGKDKEVEKGAGKTKQKGGKGMGKQQEQEADGSETEEEEPDLPDTEGASVKRVGTAQLTLWASLLKHRGYAVNKDNSRLVRSPTKSQSLSRTQTEAQLSDGPLGMARPNNTGSILSDSGFRRANSFGPIVPRAPKRILSSKVKHALVVDESADQEEGEAEDKDADGFNLDGFGDSVDPMEIDTPGAGPSSPKPQQPQQSSFTLRSTQNSHSEIQNPSSSSNEATSSIFAGLKFLALGEAKCPNVKAAVEGCKGIYLDKKVDSSEYPDDVDVVIVRLSNSKLFSNLDSAPPSWCEKFRTECWLERCIYEDRICPPEQNVCFTPVPVSCPIKGSNKVFMSCSGFDEAERLFMKRLLKVLGITLLPVFSRRATHLLCPSAEGLKYDKAKEWNIPVVGMEWMEEIKRMGSIPDVDRFLVSGASSVVERESGSDPKGKRKATIGGDPKIADITNGQSQSPNQNDSSPSVPTQEASQNNHNHNHKADPPPASPQHLKGHPSSVPSLSKLVIIDEQSSSGPSRSESFGKPDSLLRSANNSKPATREQSESELALAQAGSSQSLQAESSGENYLDFDTGFGQPPESFSDVAADDSVLPETRPSTPHRSRSRGRGFPTAIVGLQDDDDMRIPSSETPSPMKGVQADTDIGNGQTNANTDAMPIVRRKSTSVSPSKFYPPPQPMDEEKTRALHESLTSLLGKRRSEDGTEGMENNNDANGTGNGRKAPERGGKRHRPLRVKSTTSLQLAPIEPLHSIKAFLPEHDVMTTELSLSMMEDELQEQSLRVTYEDPAPKESRKRTTALLDSTLDAGPSKAKDRMKGKGSDSSRRPSRRSSGQRQSGF
ncbi:hypothetical protein D9758_013575 [Tetrapyrgos nigripes]|uniref:BRCT domain-containing protein n=1 Tax=Tetrapyrgos nigripes TaxID=182062 RepID=A0A8H5CEX0_9AGAR|nr:hypothetical protein D9758_013575 [Tetrapyrgos nigripes]